MWWNVARHSSGGESTGFKATERIMKTGGIVSLGKRVAQETRRSNTIQCANRVLSTEASSSVSSAPSNEAAGSYSYVASRREYKAEIARLRQIFLADEKRRLEQLAREREAERLRIQKEKAERLVIKRQKQAIRAAEVAKERAAHDAAVRKYFESKVQVRQECKQEQQKRQQAMLELLREQTKSWITEDNIEEKAQSDLFSYNSMQTASTQSLLHTGITSTALTWLERLQKMKPVESTPPKAAAKTEASSEDKPKE